MDIYTCEQGTEEWFSARLGIPTASMFATVMAKGKGGAPSKTRRTYLYKLAGEVITGEPMEGYSNGHMERGQEMEAQARAAYEFHKSVGCETVGFIKDGRKGCSPDALVGATGMVEIKTKLPHLMVEAILRDAMPPEHRAQAQGQLWVADREWVDLVAYWPGMPLFIHREFRDEDYIADLSKAVDAFNADLDEIVATVRGYEPKQPDPIGGFSGDGVPG